MGIMPLIWLKNSCTNYAPFCPMASTEPDHINFLNYISDDSISIEKCLLQNCQALSNHPKMPKISQSYYFCTLVKVIS